VNELRSQAKSMAHMVAVVALNMLRVLLLPLSYFSPMPVD
jgi:hypothetical protein